MPSVSIHRAAQVEGPYIPMTSPRRARSVTCWFKVRASSLAVPPAHRGRSSSRSSPRALTMAVGACLNSSPKKRAEFELPCEMANSSSTSSESKRVASAGRLQTCSTLTVSARVGEREPARILRKLSRFKCDSRAISVRDRPEALTARSKSPTTFACIMSAIAVTSHSHDSSIAGHTRTLCSL